MKLKLAIQADIGDTVSTEGGVGYIGKPKHITGSKNGQDYDFYSQFITIEDGDDKIGVGISFNNESDCLANKGEQIKIKGVMGSYEKDGKTVFKIDRSKLVRRAGGTKESSGATASYGNKDRLIVTQVVFKAMYGGQVDEVTEGNIADYVDMIMRVGENKPIEAKPAAIEDPTDFGSDDDLPF